MARQAEKRKLVRRPGLAAAALELGCTLSHLRRVIIGERVSVRLTARMDEWKRKHPELMRPAATKRKAAKAC